MPHWSALRVVNDVYPDKSIVELLLEINHFKRNTVLWDRIFGKAESNSAKTPLYAQCTFVCTWFCGSSFIIYLGRCCSLRAVI